MKPNLKRIEATLHQPGTISTTSHPEPIATREAHAPQTRNRAYSFEISSAAQKCNAPAQPLHDVLDETACDENTLLPSTVDPQPFSARQSSSKAPMLPKFKSSLSKDGKVANPGLEMNLLKETQIDVAACQAEILQIVRQIQDIYLEGPIVDGWLESEPCPPEPGAVMLRSMDGYVEEVCSLEQEEVTLESPRPGYRLCGLNAAGQMWSHPCPVEQLPSISIAIARYQKLRQLLERKQYLETRLSQEKD